MLCTLFTHKRYVHSMFALLLSAPRCGGQLSVPMGTQHTLHNSAREATCSLVGSHASHAKQHARLSATNPLHVAAWSIPEYDTHRPLWNAGRLQQSVCLRTRDYCRCEFPLLFPHNHHNNATHFPTTADDLRLQRPSAQQHAYCNTAHGPNQYHDAPSHHDYASQPALIPC